MKRNIFLLLLIMFSGVSFSASTTIINSGFSFSPGEVSVNSGDTVIFSLGSIHNAVEVSEATWNSNGNTPLAGGFSVGFGGGVVTGLQAGVHYYVCAPHASSGMKGKITVNSQTGLPSLASFQNFFMLYPNPTKGNLHLKYPGAVNENSGNPLNSQTVNLEILTLDGKMLYALNDLKIQPDFLFDLSDLQDGYYLIRIITDRKSYVTRIIKE